MKFSRRRGRPKRTNPIGKDKGTAELQQKREANLTSEPLDLCLAKGLINEEQHNAGIRLRWLYTLKLGAPTISAYNPGEAGGASCKYDDETWLAYRQEEYNLILALLDKNKCRNIIVNTCIMGQAPGFLTAYTASLQRPRTLAYKELNLLIKGLDLISTLKKKRKNYFKLKGAP